MDNLSKRHHYIPKFLIEGFTNTDNKIFVYDKQANGGQGKIRDNPVPPKSIFFEEHRNTMAFDKGKSSVIEDVTYSKFDTFYSQFFRELKSLTIGNDEIPNAPLYGVHLFIMNLFWRIPAHDPVAKGLVKLLTLTLMMRVCLRLWLSIKEPLFLIIPLQKLRET